MEKALETLKSFCKKAACTASRLFKKLPRLTELRQVRILPKNQLLNSLVCGAVFVILSLTVIGMLFAHYHVRYVDSSPTGKSDGDGIVLIADDEKAMDLYRADGSLKRTARYDESNGRLMLREYYVFRDVLTEKQKREGVLTAADVFDPSGTMIGYRFTYYSGMTLSYVDQSWNVTRTETYGTDGKLSSIVKCTYDKKGNLTGKAELDATGKGQAYYVWRYSPTNKVTEYMRFDSNRHQIDRVENVYDAEDRLSIVNTYDEKDELVEYASLFYDKKGKLTKESHYAKGGMMLYYRVFEYGADGLPTGGYTDYNAAGQLVTR